MRVLYALSGLSLTLTTACASVDPGGSFADVQRNVAERTSERLVWARTEAESGPVDEALDELLAGDLTVDRAVQVAVLNNPSLQAVFEQVGISQADLAQASRIANPDFALSARYSSHLSGANLEMSIVQDIFDVFIQPLRKDVAEAQLEQTKLRVSNEVLNLAARVKTAYFTAQAREQLVSRLRLIEDVTKTAADFAEKQFEAGTLGQLDLETQQALYRESRVDVALAEAEVRSDREHLNRLLGLWGARTTWMIDAQLPSIEEQEIPLEGLESLAMRQRYDLQAARFGVDLVGRALALRKKTRWFPVGIHVGIDTEKDILEERVTGPTLALQLPIFDTGSASIARLEAEHRRAQRQLEAVAVNARSEVRESRDRMLAYRDLALYYGNVLLPQRARILDLTMRYYNMMLKGAYDLLLAKRAEVETERAHVQAWRDYWIARVELERALGGALPVTPPEQKEGDP